MRVVCLGNFQPLLIEFVIPNLSRIYFYIPDIFKTNIKNRFLSTKNTLWIYVLVVLIHRGYCVVKKLVWNIRIKAFWYTKYIICTIYCLQRQRLLFSKCVLIFLIAKLIFCINHSSYKRFFFALKGNSVYNI